MRLLSTYGTARTIRKLLSSYADPVSLPVGKNSKNRGWVDRMLVVAGIRARVVVRVLMISVIVAGVVGISGGFGYGLWMGLLGVLIGVFYWRQRFAHRRMALDRDLPALLTSLASSVRAGVDPITALVSAAEYLPQGTPLIEELSSLKHRIKSGGDEIAELELFLADWRHPDAELFKRCLILSRKHGSSLGEPLHRITRVVRQRHSFRRKTKAALAMHRLSAFGIALCAVVIGVFQGLMNKQALIAAVDHPLGSKLLVVGVVLICVGVGWMVLMGSEEVA
jgi:Flp pilus assembly protein TadB